MSVYKMNAPKKLALEKKLYQPVFFAKGITSLKNMWQWLRSVFLSGTPASGNEVTMPSVQKHGGKKADNLVRTGIVKFFNRSKGFGFIRDGNGIEIFVHNSGLISRISENDKVSFELVQSERGLNAVNVALIRMQKTN